MRFISDTCIFGVISIDKDVDQIIEKIRSSSKYVICDFKIIRDEIRAKKQNHSKSNTTLTSLYDRLARGKKYTETSAIICLADEYYKAYKGNRGNVGKHKILHDFKIVACASIGGMNVLVSEDSRTMLSDKARKAYEIVNNKNKRKTPEFWNYKKFKEYIFKN
jgi:predicted nucleic acid-binding protein